MASLNGLRGIDASVCEALEILVTGLWRAILDQLGIMAHRFARSARLLAFSPGRAAAAAALPTLLVAQHAKAEANNDKETVAAAAAAAAVPSTLPFRRPCRLSQG